MAASAVAIFLVLGPERAQWPAPLAELIAQGRVRVERVSTMYEAAVHLATISKDIRGLLLDPRVLVRRDVQGLVILMRRVVLALVLLPLDEGASPCVAEVEALGVLRWEHAAPAWAALAVTEAVREAPRFAAPKIPAILPASTDNALPPDKRNGHEKSVTSAGANRYDELAHTARVSAAELAALLEDLD